MFRVAFTVSIPGMEGSMALGEIISHEDDPFKALAEGTDKKPIFVQALRATVPAFKAVKVENIQIGVFPYSVQLLLFDVPAQQREEIDPEAKIGYELFQNDLAPTLQNPSGNLK